MSAKRMGLNLILTILGIIALMPISSWGKTNKNVNNLQIYLYNIRYQGPYLLKNHQIYLAEKNFKKTLSIQYKFPKTIELTNQKRLFLSLQRAAKYLDSYVILNWKTGIIEFLPHTVSVPQSPFPMTGSATIIESPTPNYSEQPTLPPPNLVETSPLYYNYNDYGWRYHHDWRRYHHHGSTSTSPFTQCNNDAPLMPGMCSNNPFPDNNNGSNQSFNENPPQDQPPGPRIIVPPTPNAVHPPAASYSSSGNFRPHYNQPQPIYHNSSHVYHPVTHSAPHYSSPTPSSAHKKRK
jgi:hypothetical protein